MPPTSEATTTTSTTAAPRRRITRRSGPATPPPGSPAAELAAKPALRIRPRQPLRALIGALVVVASVVAALAIYAAIGDRDEVLIMRNAVAPGEVIAEGDVMTAAMASDDGITAVSPAERDLVVGAYAVVQLQPGMLLTPELVQVEPLVTEAAALIGVPLPAQELPVGLRAQTRIVLVVTVDDDRPSPVALEPATGDGADGDAADGSGDRDGPIVLIEALITAVPGDVEALVAEADRGSANVTLSVEVARAAVPVIAAAAAVTIAVFEPWPDEVEFPFPVPQDESQDGAST